MKEKRREETNQNEKGLMNKNFVIEYFDVVLVMKQKQRRNQKKERDKSKEETKRKKETKARNQKKAKKDKKEGRERKKKWKRGRPNKAMEKERETL